jgi:hypothetical protein
VKRGRQDVPPPAVGFGRFVLVVAAAGIYVAFMLLSDSPGLLRQLLLGAATGLALLALVRGLRLPGLPVTAAMSIATALEIVGSIHWGIYRYRHAAIPFYVPFGHGIFYALAYASAAQEPLRRHSGAIVRGVLAAGTLYVLASFVLLHDVSGLVMWGLAVTVILTVRTPLLMATSCVYTVALEWAGTTIGNWRWASVAPGLGLPSANPPSGVAIAYCLVDLLTVALCASPWLLQNARPRPPDPIERHRVALQAGRLLDFAVASADDPSKME